MPNSKTKSASFISRRTVLRGAGVTMALPWLESLPCFAAPAKANPFPKRFGVLFMGNGVNEDHWGSVGSGAEMHCEFPGRRPRPAADHRARL